MKTMLHNYREKLYELLSKEFNCTPTDFIKQENVLTISALQEGRRICSKEKYFFHMVTLGGNAVLTAEECLHPFLKDFMKDRAGHWLFELPNLLPLQQELNRFGYTLTQTYHMFLPAEQTEPKKNYAVKWFTEKRKFHNFMEMNGFRMLSVPNICHIGRIKWWCVPMMAIKSWAWQDVPRMHRAGCRLALMYCRNIVPRV